MSGEGILGVCPPNFYMDLDFWNGLEHDGGGGVATVNVATKSSRNKKR